MVSVGFEKSNCSSQFQFTIKIFNEHSRFSASYISVSFKGSISICPPVSMAKKVFGSGSIKQVVLENPIYDLHGHSTILLQTPFLLCPAPSKQEEAFPRKEGLTFFQIQSRKEVEN